MKSPLFLLFIFLFGFSSKPESKQEAINVLFIGNSLTYYHDMPKMLQEMLNETHSNYNIEQSAFPGMTLDDHLNNIFLKVMEITFQPEIKKLVKLQKRRKNYLRRNGILLFYKRIQDVFTTQKFWIKLSILLLKKSSN